MNGDDRIGHSVHINYKGPHATNASLRARARAASTRWRVEI
jgi:hypothetical protein